MKLIGVVSTYNSSEHLRFTLESIAPVCDRLVVVDGAYTDFPHMNGSPYSTDGTEFLCLEFGAELIKFSGSESEKRNQYFVGNIGDWYLRLDDDEVLEEGSTAMLRAAISGIADLDCVYVGFKDVLRHVFFWRPRLFKHVEGLKHVGRSDDLLEDSKKRPYAVQPNTPQGDVYTYSYYYHKSQRLLHTPDRSPMFEQLIVHDQSVRSLEYYECKSIMHAKRTGNNLPGLFNKYGV